MALSQDQIRSLWITDQASNSPRYALMNQDQKTAFEKDLGSYFDNNQTPLINRYSGNSIDLGGSSSAVNDDSNRTPMSQVQSSRVAGSGVQTNPNVIPLIDDPNNRVIYFDKRAQTIVEIWYYDDRPSASSSQLIGKIDSNFLDGHFHESTNDPIGLATLMFNGQYCVKQLTSDKIYWFDAGNPAALFYIFNRGERGNWLPTKGTNELGFNDVTLLNGLVSGSIDPNHPEAFNSSWSLLSTDYRPPTTSVSNHGGGSLYNVSVNVIFYGNDWPDFYDINQPIEIVKNALPGYVNLLAQYGVNNLTVGNVNKVPIGDGSINTITDIIDSDVVNLISGLYPNPNGIYIILLGRDVSMSYKGSLWVYNPNTNGNIGVEYHDYKLNKYIYGVIRYVEEAQMSSITLSSLIINMVTNPYMNGWYDSAGNEVALLCGGRELINSGALINPIWSNYNNVCKSSSNVRITSPVPLSSALFHTYFWDLPSYRAFMPSFRLMVEQNPNDVSDGSWLIKGTVNASEITTIDQWYNTYILPIINRSQVTIPITDTLPIASTQDIINTIQNSGVFSATLIKQGNNYSLFDVYQKDSQLSHTYHLYYLSDFLTTFVNMPSDFLINNAIIYRSQIFDMPNETVHWSSGVDGWGQLVGGISSIADKGANLIYTFQEPNPYDCDMFQPGQFFMMRFEDNRLRYIWWNKAYPWYWRMVSLAQNQDYFNISDLRFDQQVPIFVGAGAIIVSGSNTIDPNSINSNWSTESSFVNETTGKTNAVWKFGGFFWDTAYRLTVEYTPWIDDINRKFGITVNPLGYMHTDIDGVIRSVNVNNQIAHSFSMNTIGGPSAVFGPKISVPPYIAPVPTDANFKYYYDLYTLGRNKLSGNTTIWDNDTYYLKCYPSDGQAFDYIGDILTKYPFLKVIDQSGEDWVLLEGIELVSKWTLRLWFERLDFPVWAPPAPAGAFINRVGGYFLSRIYFVDTSQISGII